MPLNTPLYPSIPLYTPLIPLYTPLYPFIPLYIPLKYPSISLYIPLKYPTISHFIPLYPTIYHYIPLSILKVEISIYPYPPIHSVYPILPPTLYTLKVEIDQRFKAYDTAFHPKWGQVYRGI